MFTFTGHLEISKSWMNRALIIQSYQKNRITIQGDSSSDDVQLLKKALLDLENQKTEFEAGLGGTTFRFLALRLSREVGQFFINCNPRLLERPQIELINILKQLGVSSELTSKGLKINSNGWKEPSSILKVSTRESSQFLSAVLLNSIDLNFDLLLQIEDEIISEDYFKYTTEILKKVGLQTIQIENSIFIKKDQKLNETSLLGELDISSAFALISAAVLNGHVNILNWNSLSLQPDMEFKKIFLNMGISFIETENTFKINTQSSFKNINVDLGRCPDLFPVLAVVCAFAEGSSRLFGAPQLKYKESNRILKTAELLNECGFKTEIHDDGLTIFGHPDLTYKYRKEIFFNPDHDHRMAMAAALLKLKGFPIHLTDSQVINKSYPQFYQHIGLQL